MLKKTIAILMALCLGLPLAAFAVSPYSVRAQELVAEYDGTIRDRDALLRQVTEDLYLFEEVDWIDGFTISSVADDGTVTYQSVISEEPSIIDYFFIWKEEDGSIAVDVTEGEKHNVLVLKPDGRLYIDGHEVGLKLFDDQEEIVYYTAVEMCFALDLFKGYPDGTFRPAKEITRAELSKVVCLALNGGEEPTPDQSAPTFADVEGHWAAPYIRWCAAQGLVSGMSADRFAPDEGVTAVQAARILLTALGCDPEKEGFTGPQWIVQVNARAQEVGLYDKLDGTETGAALTRDDAAQLLWNALNAPVLAYVQGTGTLDGKEYPKLTLEPVLLDDGETPLTLLIERFGWTA